LTLLKGFTHRRRILKHVRVERNAPGKYAVAYVCKEPVNAMDAELWEELQQVLDEMEADKGVRALIFASGLKRDIFTAGNDLKELYGPLISEESYRRFWGAQNTFLPRLYRSPLYTVAAIRGACPAGGCILSLMCDHRVQTTQGHIGLNEVALGIPVPRFWAQAFCRITGSAKGERLLGLGKMLSPRQALDLGLLHEVVEKDDLLEAALQAVRAALKLPDAGRVVTKQALRGDLAHAWENGWQEEVAPTVRMLQSPKVVAGMKANLERLSSKKKAAPAARL
jgi:3,2-trans-enoyl-CoA isomerase